MTVCTAPESVHSASRLPTAIMMTPPLCIWVVRVRLSPSRSTALCGMTVERWSRIVDTASGPAKTLKAPTATSSVDGMARNA